MSDRRRRRRWANCREGIPQRIGDLMVTIRRTKGQTRRYRVIVEESDQIRCRRCGATFAVTCGPFRCPNCQAEGLN